MKKYILGAVLSLGMLIAPTLTQAVALTTAQSTSLIAVVQSSPGTPASAFVNLITAFSNITVNQATSLIAVVQASPSTHATAFVDLLTSFTVDTATAQPTTPATNQAVTPTSTQSTTSATQTNGSLLFTQEPVVKLTLFGTTTYNYNPTQTYQMNKVTWKTNKPTTIENYAESWMTGRSDNDFQYTCLPWDASWFYVGKTYQCNLNLISSDGQKLHWDTSFTPGA